MPRSGGTAARDDCSISGRVRAHGDTDHSNRDISTLLHILKQMQAPSCRNAIATRTPGPRHLFSSALHPHALYLALLLFSILVQRLPDWLCHCMHSPLYKPFALKASRSFSSVSAASAMRATLTTYLPYDQVYPRSGAAVTFDKTIEPRPGTAGPTSSFG